MSSLSGLVFIAPARRAGDPGSNPGPGENFFSQIINKDLVGNIPACAVLLSGAWHSFEKHVLLIL